MSKKREPIGIIMDENPENHWGFLPVQDKVVLDLGCGINSEFTPTPWFFHQDKKCSKIYGVDGDINSYNWFKQNYNVENFIHFCDMVDRLFKFEWYIGNTNPDVIKIDVEGAEIFLLGLDPKYLLNVSHIAIEYHNLSCLVACEKLLEENGFLIQYYKFGPVNIEHQGVIYGRKPQNPDEQLNMELSKFKPLELKKIN